LKIDKKNQRFRKLKKAAYFLDFALQKEKAKELDPRVRHLRV